VVHEPSAHPSRMKRRLLRAATVRERIRLLTRAALSVLFSEQSLMRRGAPKSHEKIRPQRSQSTQSEGFIPLRSLCTLWPIMGYGEFQLFSEQTEQLTKWLFYRKSFIIREAPPTIPGPAQLLHKRQMPKAKYVPVLSLRRSLF
jgi:hypothetical protein